MRILWHAGIDRGGKMRMSMSRFYQGFELVAPVKYVEIGIA